MQQQAFDEEEVKLGREIAGINSSIYLLSEHTFWKKKEEPTFRSVVPYAPDGGTFIPGSLFVMASTDVGPLRTIVHPPALGIECEVALNIEPFTLSSAASPHAVMVCPLAFDVFVLGRPDTLLALLGSHHVGQSHSFRPFPIALELYVRPPCVLHVQVALQLPLRPCSLVVFLVRSRNAGGDTETSLRALPIDRLHKVRNVRAAARRVFNVAHGNVSPLGRSVVNARPYRCRLIRSCPD
jgi:hypothetical protein